MKNNTLEIIVGLFMVAGFGALVYLALNLGEVPLLSRGATYTLFAEFDDVSGVKEGASVQVSGVVVGDVGPIDLTEDGIARIALRLDRELRVPLDSIASVKSQGIIGDKYIKISMGGDLESFEEKGVIVDTESAIDIESLISKFAFGSAE